MGTHPRNPPGRNLPVVNPALAACASGDIGRTVIWQYRKKPPNIGKYTIK